MTVEQHQTLQDPSIPFPTRQLTILALCRICEPIAFTSIFPYVYFMIQDFNIADAQISIYACMVTSVFAFAECCSGAIWGRVSDQYGRKPVLLIGLAGTALSMLILGFARSVPIALLARALGGLLNGNLGILQTTVAEIVKAPEHQPRAYTIMPFVWCLGSILGSCIGGVLSRPVAAYPSFFPPGSIWEHYPYLLPNLVCVFIILWGMIIGILFLEETLETRKDLRDLGIQPGSECCVASNQETMPLLVESESCADGKATILQNRETDVPRTKEASISQVTQLILSYGILAYHTMTFDALLPTLLSTNVPIDNKLRLPFKFLTGYGLDSHEIGMILSMQSIYSMFAINLVFPALVRRFGALALFKTVTITYPFLYFMTPYMGLLPSQWRLIGIYGLIGLKCTLFTIAYPSHAILLTNSVRSRSRLGTINGVAASTASFSRAFSPIISGYLYSGRVLAGYSGLPWWCNAFVAIVGTIVSMSLTDGAIQDMSAG